MSGRLHDLRGGPDVAILDAGAGPRQDGQAFYVRLPPAGSSESFDGETERKILREVMAQAAKAGATGVVLPGFVGTPDLERLGAMLAVVEAEHDLTDGSLAIFAIADSPAGILALPSLRATPRLVALACDPTRLAATLGCDETAPAIVTARVATILTAAAFGVRAVLVADDASPGLCADACREGFAAVLAAENRR